ncbi:MAG: CoA transferase, partial [Proteobacteria bacterium]|nr:CoA transferase [Pseudomonadota bacterium]
VAIACQDDEAWQVLCEVAGFDDLVSLTSLGDRKQREDELEARISSWTSGLDENDIQAALIDRGIAAYVVQNGVECMADPQNIARDHFIQVPQASVGDIMIENSRYRLSRTPARVDRAGPDQGEHNFEVLSEVLGYDGARIADIYASLAME